MLCTFCQARIAIQAFCPECGNPTAYASREERIQFELERWGKQAPKPPDRVIDLAALEREREERLAERRAAEAPERQAQPPRRRRPNRQPPKPALHTEPLRVEIPAPPPPAQEPATARLHMTGHAGPERWRRAFRPLPDETIGFVKEGRCGPERATLIITKYRAVVVQGHRSRWIPVENIDTVELVEGRATRLVIGGSIERIAFRHPDRKLLEAIRDVLRHEARLGNMPGGLRHHPDVMQEWLEGVTDVWKASFRPVRLWLHRHPAAAAVLH
jgi:hypothetical protein